ncbi:OmpL47-type beta-barrel domain-containing protein [Streptomyces sp. MAR4 CNX-425]|uniref:OmpL47-type beta-barrel domain-containing protein n=1 Tax=Streptomyces sp. MAR4 CNX-425 TaxID=3406343 RepID=UPI003B50E613
MRSGALAAGTLRRALITVVAVCLALLAPGGLPAADAAAPEEAAAAQTLTWTAGDSMTEYTSAPTTAVAGETTIVFENSAATGNTTGMVHTLTFDTFTDGYNKDVDLNIQASPNDTNGGRYEATVTLTPGTYRYFCAIPGHTAMSGELVVTDGGGTDTTAPEATAEVTGEQNADGAYLGSATAELSATDDMSGVDRIDYALDGATGWTAYEAPVVVNVPGEHTLRYRATDKAGNTSEEKSVTFSVVEADDTAPPTVTASVSGEQNDDGAYLDVAVVTLEAADTGGSGLDKVEYAVGGGDFRAYTEPVQVHTIGEHTVTYRATDKAGNSSEPGTATFTVVEKYPNPDPVCPELDSRPIVFIGEYDTHVPNRVTASGCTINEVIEDERAWEKRRPFLRHIDEITDELYTDAVINGEERETIRDTAKATDIGKPGHNDGYTSLFTGTENSFSKWEQVGGGSFNLNGDGSMTSDPTVEGMGMLWYPQQQYGDFSLKLQWRDDAPGDARTNGGVFVRFPDVRDHPDESRPEWVAIKYGHEIQIFDSEAGDQYKTGSVYGFDRVGHGAAGVTPKGTWNDYEIRVVDQHYEVYRNGVLINEFDNTPGQVFEPPRADDPGTDGRQHAQGYIGLQVHSTTDVVSYRDIRIKPL